MTPEERWIKIENAIQALLERQAKHEALIDKHTVQIDKHTAQLESRVRKSTSRMPEFAT